MRQRDAGLGRTGQRRGDAGHDLEGYPCGGERLRLFAAAAEDERVPAFQAHHLAPLPRQPHQQVVDALLRQAVVRPRLADVDPLGIASRHVQHVRADEPVVHDDVRFAQQAVRPQGQQVGCPGAGAHEVDDAGGFGALVELACHLGPGGIFGAHRHEVGDAAA